MFCRHPPPTTECAAAAVMTSLDRELPAEIMGCVLFPSNWLTYCSPSVDVAA